MDCWNCQNSHKSLGLSANDWSGYLIWVLKLVFLTFARTTSNSSSANLLPRHILDPNPNGMKTKGWAFLASGRVFSSGFTHLSGMNFLLSRKCSSVWHKCMFTNITSVCGIRIINYMYYSLKTCEINFLKLCCNNCNYIFVILFYSKDHQRKWLVCKICQSWQLCFMTITS